MILTRKKQLTVSETAKLWSYELGLPPDQIRVLIERELWRGVVERLRGLRLAWVNGLEWLIPRPLGEPSSWSAAEFDAYCELVAEYWPGDDDSTEVGTEIWLGDVVLYLADLEQIAEAMRAPAPTFWGPGAGKQDDARPDVAVPKPKKRGPPPVLLNRLIGRMQADIDSGKYTYDQLRAMKQVELAAEYNAKETTAVTARKWVLVGR